MKCGHPVQGIGPQPFDSEMVRQNTRAIHA